MKIVISKIYRLFLTVINLSAFYLLGERRVSKRKLASYKGKYKGKRCFIVCNGPSLKAEDLDKIADSKDVSIGINQIARIYPKTKWRPDILFSSEDGVYKKKNRDLLANCEAGIRVFQDINYLRSLKNKGNKVFSHCDGNYDLLDNPRFSLDISEKFYSIGTTTYEAIEMAVYMGCSPIYLIGCDMSWAVNVDRNGCIYYNESGQNHFYGKEVDSQSHIIPNPTWQMIAAFDAAERFSREYGFRIFNATRGGKCESFERVYFDSLF